MTIRKLGGRTPEIDKSAYVDETALVVGDVALGEDSSAWPMSVLRGDVQRIRIGDRTNIQDGSILHVTSDSEYSPGGTPLVLGNDITVGHSCTLHACTVEDLCLIGIGSIVLDGAVIRSGAMLAAGCLVPPGKEIEGGYLWVGSPAKRHRELTGQEVAYLRHSAEHYVRVKNKHAAGGHPAP